jgi:hypothetical protein
MMSSLKTDLVTKKNVAGEVAVEEKVGAAV